MAVGVQISYSGEEFSIDLLPLFMFLYITQVLPVIFFHLFFFYSEVIFFLNKVLLIAIFYRRSLGFLYKVFLIGIFYTLSRLFLMLKQLAGHNCCKEWFISTI